MFDRNSGWMTAGICAREEREICFGGKLSMSGNREKDCKQSGSQIDRGASDGKKGSLE